MVKHTQTIRPLLPMNCLSRFHHFIGLLFKGLTKKRPTNGVGRFSNFFSLNLSQFFTFIDEL